ncbi:unnamed protein product, partial [Gulo gulo]
VDRPHESSLGNFNSQRQGWLLCVGGYGAGGEFFNSLLEMEGKHSYA